MRQTHRRNGLQRAIVLVFFVTASAFFVERYLEERAVRVRGLVIREVTERSLLGGERASRIVVAYTVGGNRRNLVVPRGLVERLSGSFEPGTRIPVLVSRSDPNDARLGTRLHVYTATMSLALVTIFLLGVRAILVVQGLVRRLARSLEEQVDKAA